MFRMPCSNGMQKILAVLLAFDDTYAGHLPQLSHGTGLFAAHIPQRGICKMMYAGTPSALANSVRSSRSF